MNNKNSKRATGMTQDESCSGYKFILIVTDKLFFAEKWKTYTEVHGRIGDNEEKVCFS